MIEPNKKYNLHPHILIIRMLKDNKKKMRIKLNDANKD